MPEDLVFICNFKAAYNSRYLNIHFNTLVYTATIYEASEFGQTL